MKRLLILLVVVAAGVAWAAVAVPSNAATVNGSGISQSALNSDLSAIANSSGYQCLLRANAVVRSDGQSTLPPLQGVGTGTYNTQFVDYWLSQMVNAQLIEQLVASRGLPITSSDLATARTDLDASYTSALSEVTGSQYACQGDLTSILGQLPASFVDEQVRLEAATEVLLLGPNRTDAAIARYFSQHRSSFDRVCVSAIVTSSQADATKIRQSIEQGEPFASAAKAGSIDTQNAANGGVLGCFSPTSSEYASLIPDVGSLKVGAVSQPIALQSGEYVLFTVTRRSPTTLPEVRSAVRKALLSRGQTSASRALTVATRRSDVWVDAQYGRWKTRGTGSGILAPANPPVGSLLNASANTPGTTSSASSAGGSTGTSGGSSSTSGQGS